MKFVLYQHIKSHINAHTQMNRYNENMEALRDGCARLGRAFDDQEVGVGLPLAEMVARSERAWGDVQQDVKNKVCCKLLDT